MSVVESDLTRLNAEKAHLVVEDRHQQSLLDGIKTELAALQKRFTQKGGHYAVQKAANDARAGELESRHQALLTLLREECDSALPFMLCPELSARLTSELHAESALRNFRLVDQELTNLQKSVLTAAAKRLSGSGKTELFSFLDHEFTRFRNSRRPVDGAAEIHSLSERDATLSIEFLSKQAPLSARRVHTALVELEDVTRELRVVKADSEHAPEQLVLQDTFAELNTRNQDLGRVEEVKRKVAEQLQQTENAIVLKEREKAKIETRLGAAQDVVQKKAMIEKLNGAISAYMTRLTQAKIAQLQSEVTECYNRLRSQI